MKLGLATIGVVAAMLLVAPKGAGATVIDLGTSAHSVRLDGQAKNDQAGTSVASAGDVNGDGTPDFIVGARSAIDHPFQSGSAYVIFGRHTTDPADIRLARITTKQASRGVRIDGAAQDDRAGTAVAMAGGDVNADHRADVLVGAPDARNNGPESGSTYVLDLRR